MSKLRTGTLAQVAGLLNKFAERLAGVSRETRQNTDAIAVLRDELRLKIGKSQITEEILAAHIEDAKGELKREADSREGRQALRDQNNVQALVNLRDSTSKAFTQVKADIEELMKRIQRLNERAGQVESQNLSLSSSVSLISNRTSNAVNEKVVNAKLEGILDVTGDLEGRVAKIEEGPCAAFHHMVGIEKRVTELEHLLELYEGLRKAQNALAVANGAFLAGPK